jgi:hypothetical protein
LSWPTAIVDAVSAYRWQGGDVEVYEGIEGNIGWGDCGFLALIKRIRVGSYSETSDPHASQCVQRRGMLHQLEAG